MIARHRRFWWSALFLSVISTAEGNAATTPILTATDDSAGFVITQDTNSAPVLFAPQSAPAPEEKIDFESAEKKLAHEVKLSATPLDTLTNRTSDSLVLSLKDAMTLLIRYNPDIQEAKYEWISRSEMATAAYGDFEPRLVGRLNKEEGERPGARFAETKDEYKLGVEGKLPTGTEYNVGFNQVTYRHSDYTSEIYFGAELKQPVLRGFWYWAPLNNVQQAHQEEMSAFHQYRKTLTEIIEKVSTAYWDYYYALQVLHFETESVDVAKSICADGQKRLQQGKLSAIDLRKAIAELSVRQSRQIEALGAARDARSKLLLLLSAPELLKSKKILTVNPSLAIDSIWRPDSVALIDTLQKIHPEYLQQKAELERRQRIVDYHKSEILPVFNLVGAYGIRSRDDNADAAIAKFRSESRRDHVLSGGFEIEVPLFANHKERHLASAEAANVRSAQVRLGLIVNKLIEDNLILRQHAVEILEQLGYERTIVEYHQQELVEEMKKLNMGKSNYHVIFDMEEDLREAQKKEIEVVRLMHIIQIQLEQALGTLLLRNKLELWKDNEIYLRNDLVATE
jgi:outer membrane protein TolC